MGKRNMLKAIVIVALAMGMISTPNGNSAADSGFTMDMNLRNSDASFVGEVSRVFSGCSIAIAGDINGDGYDDILIGAYGDRDGCSGTGQTYLIFGKVSGWSMYTRLWNADASFWGEEADDHSGRSVAGAGDVNGDGYDDILVGAPNNGDGGAQAGQTYLILGKASGWSMDTNLSTADASFWGEDKDDHAGYSVAGAGDVNGDGYDDILIGAYSSSNGGKTYLILGKSSGWAMDTNLSNADASFWGEVFGDWSGSSVASAGDVNNDGYDDILIGARWNCEGGFNTGQTYLIFGKASGWQMDTDLSNADASFWGEDLGVLSGWSVAGAGDVNGDGYDDISIGAPFNLEVDDTAGKTYLIFGKSSGWSMDTDLSNADASFLGEDVEDYSGYSVAGAGDVNGDGYDDILIGAMWNGEGVFRAGQTYLIFGKASGWQMDTNLSNVDASFLGEHVYDGSRLTVAGTGDVNGDGYDDILIGAPFDDDGGPDAGQTYLVLSRYRQPPIWGPMPSLDAVEDVPVTYDFTEHVSDKETPTSELEISSPSVYVRSINGLNVTFLFPDGILSSSVVLNLSDAYDMVPIEIDFIVQPVNDPPEHDIPEQQTSIEDELKMIDLASHIWDVDNEIIDLILILDSPYATAEGLDLKMLFTEGILEHDLVFDISDGIDSTEVRLHFTITPVDDPPVIADLNLEDDQRVRDSITIRGNASDDGALEKVQVRIDDGEWVDAEGTTRWTHELDTMGLSHGTHTLKVRGWDGDQWSEPISVRFFVDQVPEVTIVRPEAMARFKKTFEVSGTASDDADVLRVEFRIDGGNWTRVDGTQDWNYDIIVKDLEKGEYTLEVRAYDGEQYSDTASVIFKVEKEEETPGFVIAGVTIALLGAVLLTTRRRR